MATQFQVLVLSNSSTSQYPNNRPNDFANELIHPIRLKGEWEVAMTDMLHPFNGLNIQKEIPIAIMIADAKEGRHTDLDSGYARKEPMAVFAHPAVIEFEGLGGFPCAFRYLTLAPGYYDSVDQICKILTQRLRQIWADYKLDPPAVDFQYDPTTDRVTIEQSHYFNVLFTYGNYLQRILGFYPFTDGNMDKVFEIRLNLIECVRRRRPTTEKAYASYSPQLDTASSMFVKSDLIRYQRFGDTQAPILSMIPCQGNFGEAVYWHAEEPLYLPVAQTNIQSIKISLCCENGTKFQLAEGGITACYLSFRKKRDIL